jgi:hypothetical protein
MSELFIVPMKIFHSYLGIIISVEGLKPVSQIQLPPAEFYLPLVSPACSSFFHIVRVQFKISLEEMRHICRRWGAGRPPLWRSPAWELQVENCSLIPAGSSSAT